MTTTYTNADKLTFEAKHIEGDRYWVCVKYPHFVDGIQVGTQLAAAGNVHYRPPYADNLGLYPEHFEVDSELAFFAAERQIPVERYIALVAEVREAEYGS